MHALTKLIKEVNNTHKKLGQLIAVNVLAAKAKMCLLNVSPAGCGKTTSTKTTLKVLGEHAREYTSLTMAGLIRVANDFTNCTEHIIIDDLGAEKSTWSRTSTIEALVHLVDEHRIDKVSQTARVVVENFQGSASLNIQPVMMHTLVVEDQWEAVIRDKSIRYYHLFRPVHPTAGLPTVTPIWGIKLEEVNNPKCHGKLWYQLLTIGSTQWGHARCEQHINQLLRASAALDSRTEVNSSDYRMLTKLLKPMQLERYLLESDELEGSCTFNRNACVIFVEFATHGTPTILTVAEDIKRNPDTLEINIKKLPYFCFLAIGSPSKLMPTEATLKILDIVGVNEKW